MADDRPVRPCDVCGQEDTAPRHQHQNNDGSNQIRHLDCCRDAGCPDGTCDEILVGSENAKNDDLVSYITGES